MDKATIINNIVTKMTDFLSAKAMAVLVDAISCELLTVNIVDKPSTYTDKQIHRRGAYANYLREVCGYGVMP